jgi:hypothetical protein
LITFGKIRHWFRTRAGQQGETVLGEVEVPVEDDIHLTSPDEDEEQNNRGQLGLRFFVSLYLYSSTFMVARFSVQEPSLSPELIRFPLCTRMFIFACIFVSFLQKVPTIFWQICYPGGSLFWENY